jgi:hypothetical protein
VQIGRDPGIALPVRLELIVPPHVKGVTAEPLDVLSDQSTAKLTIRFAGGSGPFNMPLTIRATATRGDDRFVAEAALEVTK